MFTIPLPPLSKSSPPVGYTGGGHRVPSLEQIRRWATPGMYAKSGGHRYETCRGNLAWPLPVGADVEMHGLDVDAYPGKDGALALKELERLLGNPLPATWSTSSRSDGLSGIRLFEAPNGLKWPGDLHARLGFHGLDVIQAAHRYVVLPPSIHPDTGKRYQWHGPDGRVTVSAFLASPEGFTTAPEAYVRLLTGGERQAERTAVDRMSKASRNAWLATRPTGAPCEEMASALATFQAAVGDAVSGGIHDAALRGVLVLLNLAAEGHAGCEVALDALKATFLGTRQAAQRGTAEATSEWARMVARGIPKARATARDLGTARDSCSCAEYADLKTTLTTAGWRSGTAARVADSLHRKN